MPKRIPRKFDFLDPHHHSQGFPFLSFFAIGEIIGCRKFASSFPRFSLSCPSHNLWHISGNKNWKCFLALSTPDFFESFPTIKLNKLKQMIFLIFTFVSNCGKDHSPFQFFCSEKKRRGGEREEKWKERRSTSEEREEEKKASGLNGREKGGIG